MVAVNRIDEAFRTGDAVTVSGYGGWMNRGAIDVGILANSAYLIATGLGYARQESSWIDAEEYEVRASLVITGSTGTKSLTVLAGSGVDGAGATCGFGVRLHEAAGVWMVARVVSPQAAVAALSTVDVVQILPITEAGSSVGIVQELRVRFSSVMGGVRVRAWINEDSFEATVVDYTYQVDPPTGATAPRGYVAFALARSGADEMRCLGFAADTVLASAQRDDAPVSDRSTVREISEAALLTWNGNVVHPSFGEERMLTLVQKAQDELLTRLGNHAFFQRRTEVITIATDGAGVATLPYRIGRVIDMRNMYTNNPVYWEAIATDVSGALVIRTHHNYGGGQERITYTPRRTLLSMRDRVAVPKECNEALEALVVRRMVPGTGDITDYEMRASEADTAVKSALDWCAQQTEQERRVLRPVTRMARHRGPFAGPHFG